MFSFIQMIMPEGLQSVLTFSTIKYILFLLLGYFFGRIQFKIGYFIIGMVLWKCYRYWKKSHSPSAIETEDKQTEEQKNVPQKDSEEQFERIRSLNVIMKELWPYITKYVDKLLRERHQPEIRAISKYLSAIRFINIDLGEKPPQVNAMRAQADPEKKQIILDLEISCDAAVKIDMGFTDRTPLFGVKNIKLEGILRVIFAPLMEDPPLFGALTYYFPYPPLLDLHWKGLTHLLNIPGLHALTEKRILAEIGNYFISPKHLSHPLAAKFDLDKLNFKDPRNVLRIQVIEAKNLSAKDVLRNPYVVIRGGGATVQTRVIQKNLNPQWKETFEILYSDLPEQEIEFNLFDKRMKMNQPLGSCKIDAAEVPEKKCLDKWLELENVKSGQLHIKVERLRLLSDPTKLEEVLKENIRTQPERKNEISSAVLYVTIKKARGLPVIQVKRGKLLPLAVVNAAVGDSVKKLGSRVNNGEAMWTEGFQFLIRNPHTEELKVKLQDESSKLLGCITVPLYRLMAAADMTVDAWIPLDLTEQNCELLMKLQLRVSHRLFII
ncbi:hypothetical protein XENTR_v10015032 [Xenopus tropicalis]|nr:hypothetical protein XENTR_v10015032 [Xenopus tropicalis]